MCIFASLVTKSRHIGSVCCKLKSLCAILHANVSITVNDYSTFAAECFMTNREYSLVTWFSFCIMKAVERRPWIPHIGNDRFPRRSPAQEEKHSRSRHVEATREAKHLQARRNQPEKCVGKDPPAVQIICQIFGNFHTTIIPFVDASIQCLLYISGLPSAVRPRRSARACRACPSGGRK